MLIKWDLLEQLWYKEDTYRDKVELSFLNWRASAAFDTGDHEDLDGDAVFGEKRADGTFQKGID